VDAAALGQWNGGSAPVRRATSTVLPGRADLTRHASGAGPLSGRVALSELPPEGTGEHARSALLGAPVSYGRHLPDQVRDMATELAGWNPGELPGQLAAWPPAPQPATDQPPTSA
jgi:hypothetical protein